MYGMSFSCGATYQSDAYRKLLLLGGADTVTRCSGPYLPCTLLAPPRSPHDQGVNARCSSAHSLLPMLLAHLLPVLFFFDELLISSLSCVLCSCGARLSFLFVDAAHVGSAPSPGVRHVLPKHRHALFATMASRRAAPAFKSEPPPPQPHAAHCRRRPRLPRRRRVLCQRSALCCR